VRAVFEKRRDDASMTRAFEHTSARAASLCSRIPAARRSEVERLEHARVLAAPESPAREPDATN
jgi:hypothetical protein